MSENTIEFHAIEKDLIPAPYPAIKALPDWYKNLAGDIEPAGLQGTMHTIKQCPPFLDAMGAGYIIPLCGDVNFAMDDAGKLTFDCPSGDTTVETHHPDQTAGSPWGDLPVIKFMNPWIVVTPPGYSTLFLPALNRADIPFRILSGLVDTDGFYSQVNFPAACMMQPGSKFAMKRQTPLVQAIPFRREEWRAQVGHADARRVAEFGRSISHNHHVYREEFHRRKSFG